MSNSFNILLRVWVDLSINLYLDQIKEFNLYEFIFHISVNYHKILAIVRQAQICALMYMVTMIIILQHCV